MSGQHVWQASDLYENSTWKNEFPIILTKLYERYTTTRVSSKKTMKAIRLKINCFWLNCSRLGLPEMRHSLGMSLGATSRKSENESHSYQTLTFQTAKSRGLLILIQHFSFSLRISIAFLPIKSVRREARAKFVSSTSAKVLSGPQAAMN